MLAHCYHVGTSSKLERRLSSSSSAELVGMRARKGSCDMETIGLHRAKANALSEYLRAYTVLDRLLIYSCLSTFVQTDYFATTWKKATFLQEKTQLRLGCNRVYKRYHPRCRVAGVQRKFVSKWVKVRLWAVLMNIGKRVLRPKELGEYPCDTKVSLTKGSGHAAVTGILSGAAAFSRQTGDQTSVKLWSVILDQGIFGWCYIASQVHH